MPDAVVDTVSKRVLPQRALAAETPSAVAMGAAEPRLEILLIESIVAQGLTLPRANDEDMTFLCLVDAKF